ncbi:hypothetical protein L6164_023843 [Bauhinia variegata]|uniref:Uncharacterized protein n=1 Tax=Bauhinia variegata TaxID=167791 RepID=A0ACB9MJS6_BAUVA|nr:hypothetical protein L6164_023843 [Bauhinia variegata]
MRMKTTLVAFFFLAFSSALSTALGRSIAAFDADLALDDGNNPVIDGGSYILIQSSGHSGGGVELAALDGETCPISVVQGYTFLGIPVTVNISSSTQNGNYVYQTTPVDIHFQTVYPCASSSKWIVKNSTSVPSVFVGEEDDSTVPGHFLFQNIGKTYEFEDYKLVFCPDVTPASCWDVGFSSSEGERLGKNPGNLFTFVIAKIGGMNYKSIIELQRE